MLLLYLRTRQEYVAYICHAWNRREAEVVPLRTTPKRWRVPAKTRSELVFSIRSKNCCRYNLQHILTSVTAVLTTEDRIPWSRTHIKSAGAFTSNHRVACATSATIDQSGHVPNRSPTTDRIPSRSRKETTRGTS